MANETTSRAIDEHIAQFPPETRKALEEVRRLIGATAPAAVETISYGIPTFDLNGKHLVHFAGYARHIGFYPGGDGIAAFEDDLKPYKWAKGSVQFPLGQPLPSGLIRRMVEFRVQAVTGGDAGQGAGPILRPSGAGGRGISKVC